MTISSAVFCGMIPALMTPVGADGKPNFSRLVKRARELMGVGAVAVVYCGSMGEWSLLSPAQRKKGVEALVKAGVPVIVGTGAQNTDLAVEIAAHAKKVGAAGLMIIPRQLSLVSSEEAQFEHFSAVLKAGGGLPSVVYNSPYYNFQMKAGMFNKLSSKFANLVGFKEFGGPKDLTYDAMNITAGKRNRVLLVGVDTAVFHGFVNCGAVGAITGIGNVLPEEILHFLKLCKHAASGKSGCDNARRLARELSEALYTLSWFDETPKLVQYYKHLMTLEGFEGYVHSVRKTDRLTPSEKALATWHYKLFKKWWAAWDGKSFKTAG